MKLCSLLSFQLHPWMSSGGLGCSETQILVSLIRPPPSGRGSAVGVEGGGQGCARGCKNDRAALEQAGWWWRGVDMWLVRALIWETSKRFWHTHTHAWTHTHMKMRTQTDSNTPTQAWVWDSVPIGQRTGFTALQRQYTPVMQQPRLPWRRWIHSRPVVTPCLYTCSMF